MKKIADILLKSITDIPTWIITDILLEKITDIRELTEQAFFGKSSYTNGCNSMQKLWLQDFYPLQQESE